MMRDRQKLPRTTWKSKSYTYLSKQNQAIATPHANPAASRTVVETFLGWSITR